MVNGAFVYLASRSPRRRELMTQAGIPHRLLDVEVDESALPGEIAEHYVERLARSKAAAAWASLLGRGQEPAPVLAADTTVALGDQLLGKPEHPQVAEDCLMALSGPTHRVLTGIAVCYDSQVETRVVTTRVRFKELTREQTQRYVATGEPMDKAGAYGIQGFGAALVAGIEGSDSNVVGLPLLETVELVGLFNVPYWQKLTSDQ